MAPGPREPSDDELDAVAALAAQPPQPAMRTLTSWRRSACSTPMAMDASPRVFWKAYLVVGLTHATSTLLAN
jgi:hypothetical protein